MVRIFLIWPMYQGMFLLPVKLQKFISEEGYTGVHVSTPSVLDMAGYSDSNGLRVMELLPHLINNADGTCSAPTQLPSSPPVATPPVQTEIFFSKKNGKTKNDA